MTQSSPSELGTNSDIRCRSQEVYIGSQQTARRRRAQGAVKKRSQLQTKTMGIKTWIKRDTTTGALMGSEKGAGEKSLKKAARAER
jgi:hypothetical protein